MLIRLSVTDTLKSTPRSRILLVLLLGALTALPLKAQTTPNILFILCDDMGYGDVGVLWQNAVPGSKKLATPHLDRMAAEGLILNRHYCGAPVCAPSRASLLAGVHQGHTYVRNTDFDDALGRNHTLGSTLQVAGYATAMVGKYGLQGDGSSPASWTAYPSQRGFGFFHGYVRHADGHQHYPGNAWPIGNSAAHRSPKPLYEDAAEISGHLDACFTPDLFTARAKKWITDHRSANPDQPFFLYLAFDTPHAALQLPTQAYPAGYGLTNGVQWIGTPGHMINTASGTIDSWRHPDYTGQGWTDEEERFATLIRRMDDNVGDLLQTLQDLRIATNTLVVFTADNGPHDVHYISGGSYDAARFDSFGPFEGIKRDCLEGGIRQPALVWWPGTVPTNQVSQTPSQFQDWMPTFCELAGVPAPARSDGVSLLPTLTGAGVQRQGVVYVEFNQGGSAPSYPEFVNHAGEPRGNQQVIFVDGYKGLRNGIASHADNFQIYDVSVDLKEATNLFLNPPPGRAGYFQALQQRMKDRVLQVRRVESDDPHDASVDRVESRPYDTEQIPAIPATVIPGVEVAAYEGDWAWIPQFEILPPVSTATVLSVNVGADLCRSHDAGLQYRGFLRIPADGTWNFHATSDAGVHLRIHDAQVIDDDYNHNGTEVSGTLLLKAGLHPFTLSYRTESDTPSLDWEWAGPGTPKQPVPSSAMFRAGAGSGLPLAVDDNADTRQNVPVTIPVLANDLDDGTPQPLTVVSAGFPASGTNVIVAGGIRYSPESSFLGLDSFPYSISDGASTSEAVVSINVHYQAPDVWLPLNETVGGVIHEAGGAAVGAMAGFDDTDAAHVDGRFGRALAFDGSDSEAILAALPPLPGGASPRTAMAWIRTLPGPGSELQGIFGYGAAATGQRFTFRLQDSGSDQLPRLEVQSGYIIGNTPVNNGQWRHLAVVCDDFDGDGDLEVEESKFYVDGLLDTNPADPGDTIRTASAFSARTMNTAAGTAVLGGASHSGSFTFGGDIDEFRLFPYALSATEIAQYAMATNQASAAWHRRFFGSEAVDWSAHDDNDLANRLLEYGMGGQPHLDDSSRFPLRADMVDDHLEVRFPRRRAGTHDLLYTFQLTREFDDWQTLTATEKDVSPVPDQPEMEQVTMKADADPAAEPIQAGRVHIQLR